LPKAANLTDQNDLTGGDQCECLQVETSVERYKVQRCWPTRLWQMATMALRL
jgi:hypothetical protein